MKTWGLGISDAYVIVALRFAAFNVRYVLVLRCHLLFAIILAALIFYRGPDNGVEAGQLLRESERVVKRLIINYLQPNCYNLGCNGTLFFYFTLF